MPLTANLYSRSHMKTLDSNIVLSSQKISDQCSSKIGGEGRGRAKDKGKRPRELHPDLNLDKYSGQVKNQSMTDCARSKISQIGGHDNHIERGPSTFAPLACFPHDEWVDTERELDWLGRKSPHIVAPHS